MNKTSLMACNATWLDNMAAAATTLMTSNSTDLRGGGLGQTSNCVDNTGYANSYYYPVYHTSTARPIKLTMSEIERLRKAAKADDKLKGILQKFTQQIEIMVDFE